MNILHYALGFPPYRSGGLTKFCIDIMTQQYKEGHKVALLWPGSIKLMGEDSISIKDRGYINNIRSFEVINPLPISYDEGIMDVEAFVKDVPESIYINFLEDQKPDVIHVHTLMGMHKSFLSCAKKMNIKVVYTTHDYFPICPKVTLFRQGVACVDADSCLKCFECNKTALSLTKIKILQSQLYRRMKDNTVVKKLRKMHRKQFFLEKGKNDTIFLNMQEETEKERYYSLRRHYLSMLQMVDIIHCNSTVAKKVYQHFLPDFTEYRVQEITHSDIRDYRKIKKFTSYLRLTYLGPARNDKGFFLLISALDQLWEETRNFELNVFFEIDNAPQYVKCHSRYKYSDLDNIFENTDMLIAPSIWYETFGYTVLEALSFGVPVIVSGTVGARDIVTEGAGIIIEDISAAKLKKVLSELEVSKLAHMNKIIVDKQKILVIEEMCKKITEVVYS